MGPNTLDSSLKGEGEESLIRQVNSGVSEETGNADRLCPFAGCREGLGVMGPRILQD